MRGRERNLLIILAIFAVAVLLVRGAPRLYRAVAAEYQRTLDLRAAIARYQAMPASAPYWRGRQQQVALERRALAGRLLPGDSSAVAGARLQGEVRSLAEASGITIQSMGLPEFSRSGSWLLIGQSLSFQAEPAALELFLTRLRQNRYTLFVVEGAIRSLSAFAGQGGQMSCSLRLVGLGRAAGEEKR